MKLKKILIVISITMLLLLSYSLYSVYTSPDSSGTSSGTLVYGSSSPELDYLKITEAGSGTNISGLTVNTDYDFHAQVTDNNGLSEIANVTFRFKLNPGNSITADTPSFDERSCYWFCYFDNASGTTYDKFGWYNGASWSWYSDSLGWGNWVKDNNYYMADSPTTSSEAAIRIHLSKVATYSSGWRLDAIAYDDAGDPSNIRTFASITIYSYDEIIILDTTHSWSGDGGENNVPLGTPANGYVRFNITTNHVYTIQCKGSGDLTFGSNTVALSNVKFHKDTLGSATSMTTSYQNCGGYVSQSIPTTEAYQTLNVTLWINIPEGKPAGSYTYTLYIQIAS